MRTVLKFFWSDWRIGLAVIVGVAAGAGLISAWLIPSGPVTTPQALTSMAAALLVGVAAGLVTGRRWSMLVTSAMFVIVFELARLGVDGFTVDAIHLGSTYGIIAFIVGRLIPGVLVLAPMILGTVYGVWFASYLGRDASATMGAAGWTLTGLTTIALIVVAVFIAWPATTHQIVGKEMITFEHSGHRPLFEEPAAFASVMSRILDAPT